MSLPQRWSCIVHVLTVSEFSASTQQLFLPDKQPASNQSAAFRGGTEDEKEWIRTDWSLDWTTGLVDRALQSLNEGYINPLPCSGR